VNIAIVGAGWFGCHLALKLLERGHKAHIFERNDKIFKGASGNNQNRLHLGYHYPRSAQTRKEIALTHDRFIQEYPTHKVPDNLFGVADTSWIDLTSYLHIMNGEDLPCILIPASHYGIKHMEGGVVLKTDERVIDTDAARSRFASALNHIISFSANVSCENLLERFDRVIDCTSGESGQQGIFFEPAALAQYDGPDEHFSLTVMDGMFPCLYPTAERGVWRVSHVMHTARGSFESFTRAKEVLDGLDAKQITDDMTEAMCYFYPSFAKLFKPRYELVKAVRTKLRNNNASRECRTRIDERNERIFRVFSGKICAIFLVEDEVMKWVEPH
jgi:hypothetical protein